MKLDMQTVPFAELTDTHLLGIEKVFQAVFRENSPGYETGSYLNDEMDFWSLRERNRQPDAHQTGHMIMALDQEKGVVGYVMAFDGVNFRSASPDEYIKEIKDYIVEDLDFFRSLVYMKRFAFIFHIAVLPEYLHQKIGKQLLEEVEAFYESSGQLSEGKQPKPKVTLIASTIHSSQFRIFQLLRNGQENKYQFLDQQFSSKGGGMRYRIAYILDKKDFHHCINGDNLHHTFDIVIPIQLNFASQDVNQLIGREPLGAKILWSSFFTDNQQLSRFSELRRSYHGYYQPVLDAQDHGEFVKINTTLEEVAGYLKKKDALSAKSHADDTPSLTPNMSNRAFEFFFINDDPAKFDFFSHINPLVYHLMDDNGPTHWLSREEFRTDGKRRKMNEEERKECWADFCTWADAKEELDAEKEKKLKQIFLHWKLQLGITTEEEEELFLARSQSRDNQPPFHGSRKVRQKISTKKIIEKKRLKEWQEWLHLHRKMYEADCLALGNEEDKWWWCHAVVPITFTKGISGVMFTFRCRKVEDPVQARSILNDLAVNITNSLSKNMLNIIGKLQQYVIQMSMDRYAMAAVSARNLSHNVGSHILSYLGQAEILHKFLENRAKDGDKATRELAQLQRYLRTRMSLLADMATNDPVASVPCYFKREILDTFEQQSLLLQYLTGQIGEPHPVQIHFTNDDDPDNSDILIQVPNGELGASAFYMILVNLIRNCIKHTCYDPRSQLHLYVNANSEIRPRGYYITIRDDNARPYSEVKALAERIQRRYIDASLMNREFEIRHEGLGFAEMNMAARYLRKLLFGRKWRKSVTNIPFLEAVVIPKQSEQSIPAEAYLGLKLYLKRPRLLLIIDSDGKLNITRTDIDRFKDLGIKIRSQSDLQEARPEIHSHAITINLDEDFSGGGTLSRSYPIRWVNLIDPADIEKLKALLIDANREDLFSWAWELWLVRLRERTGATTHTLFSYERHKMKMTQKPAKALVFDWHGYGIEDGVISNPSDHLFYEAYGGQSPTALALLNWRDANEATNPMRKMRLGLELEEAALTRIVIVDERIQGICHDLPVPISKLRKGDYFNYLAGMRILVPNTKNGEPDLNHPGFGPDQEGNFVNYLQPFLAGGADFVVIHIGLIEQLLKVTSKTTSEDKVGTDPFLEGGNRVQDWLEKHFPPEKNTAEVVLISGRGKPSELPSWTRYLPYNNIAKYVLESPSKFYLSRMLYGARTRT